ncbi:HpcH/HpaI aldolase/citrate lyase family protein [uncultured Tateyamaria sp.]|uniref:HpcH/HpaI aldolase/citrate lyase family protein n=1 Tax=uncultured Tateyamaria sp. TaxID=455651 RepID=UPI0026319D4C|nr:HpcH/HpaI aldolase/citrate lyase family protein [uncultured Tateyamaria sp.]
MPAPKNRFKAAIQGDRPHMGCWVGLATQYAAEIVGTAGFDWLLIDGEHAPNDLRSISDQVGILQASDSDVVVRLPNGDADLIKQVLDAGVQTLLIPMVDSAEQARDLVRAVRYPPHGIRGVGYALGRASRFAAIPDYLTTADQEICLLIQVESRKGIEALDEILAVEGIDGVFIGPADLSVDLGYAPTADAPEIHAIVLDALDRIHAAGKASGILTLDWDFIAKCIAHNASFVAVGIDVLTLANGLRALAADAKEAADAR